MHLSCWDSRISPVPGAPVFTSPVCIAADFLRSERRRVEVTTFSPVRTVGFHGKVRGRKRIFVLDQPALTES